MPEATDKSKKLVWRISPTAPQGEWVAPDAAPPKALKAPAKIAEPEVSSGSWITSSFDLLHGTDIVESHDSPDTVLFEDFVLPDPLAPERRDP
jgi:hypothetical protein